MKLVKLGRQMKAKLLRRTFPGSTDFIGSGPRDIHGVTKVHGHCDPSEQLWVTLLAVVLSEDGGDSPVLFHRSAAGSVF